MLGPEHLDVAQSLRNRAISICRQVRCDKIVMKGDEVQRCDADESSATRVGRRRELL